jgi:hypothetical protein
MALAARLIRAQRALLRRRSLIPDNVARRDRRMLGRDASWRACSRPTSRTRTTFTRWSTASGPARRIPPVPEYIRLIAQRSLFRRLHGQLELQRVPGHPRPHLRPPLRAGLPPHPWRIEEKPEPVAICRLKRVAADYKGDISHLMPKIPERKNGRRIACIGAGPASLTVARDLAPLGYSVSWSSRRTPRPAASCAPRSRVPPAGVAVIDEEVGYILASASSVRSASAIDSLKALLAEGYDASSSAPAPRAGAISRLPGRQPRRRSTSTSASTGSPRCPSATSTRVVGAGDRARRRQHRDGLLPLGTTPRRRRGEGRRPLRLRRDEGLALGEGGCACTRASRSSTSSCRRRSCTRTVG